ncbi:MAG: hypothetical protein Q9218_000788 [Villophora microphyllina]
MAPIHVPENGIVLQDPPCSASGSTFDESKAQPQVMRLDLADGVLEGILKASRMGKDIHMSFGKNITLHYGNRSSQLLSIAQPTHSELYNFASSHEDELRFTGILTHKLAQKKVQENTAGADAALAALQSKMATHQQNKQSKQIKVLSETPTPSPIMKSTHPKPKAANFFTAVRGQGTKKPPTSLSGAMSRSIPGSPAIAAIRSGQATPNAPRLAPLPEDGKAQKLQALKIPLLHLVAIRPMSLKFLANKVGCSQEECKQVLEKIGKPARLDPDKWDLSDKAFKDLDVWKFAYELDDDRELAIQHTTSAYDRMRLSRDDKLWQLLLPKGERGRGKILSKLQLHQGPIQQSGTPRIHVQRTADDQVIGNPSDREGEDGEKHHLAPGDATPSARSQSAELAKKKRLEEAQSKRLLSTKPKKAAPASQAKETMKKKVTKKAATAGPNVKSAEFVRDSDEEEDEPQDSTASAPKPASTPTSTPTSKPGFKAIPKKPSPEARNSRKETASKSVKGSNGTKQSPSTIDTSSSRHRSSDASQSSTASSKPSRQRTTSSPLKPSPLGSSPPTNASDLENDHRVHLTSNSSSSSTPLLSQSRNPPANTKLRPEAAKRPPQLSEPSSDASLKRKANDIALGTHDHKALVTDGPNPPAAKRPKTSMASPSTFDSSSGDSSPFSENLLSQAQRFKNVYANYERLYQELSSQINPAAEKMDRLMKMHERLESMKDDIARAAIRR